MGLGFLIMAKFEARGGTKWGNITGGTNPQDHFSLLLVIIMLLLDAVLYFCGAIYVEAVFPGEFGVALPWYFPFMVS